MVDETDSAWTQVVMVESNMIVTVAGYLTQLTIIQVYFQIQNVSHQCNSYIVFLDFYVSDQLIECFIQILESVVFDVVVANVTRYAA